MAGIPANDIVCEALIYLHSGDYELETEIKLGLYGEEAVAQAALAAYCRNNKSLIHAKNLISEK